MIHPHGVDLEADEVEHEMIGRQRSTDGDEGSPLDEPAAIGEFDREIIMNHIDAGLK